MNIAQIVSISPAGSGYESQYGTLYPFVVGFDDNTSLAVNSKTQPPAYKVGQRVGYEVTGNYKGQSKGKVHANPDKVFQPAPQMAPPAQHVPAPGISPANQRVEQINPVFGATVGMALNQALDLLTRDLTHDERIERIITPTFWHSVHEVASDVIRVSRHLEAGNLAPSPSERSKGVQGLKKPTAAAPATIPTIPEDDSIPF